MAVVRTRRLAIGTLSNPRSPELYGVSVYTCPPGKRAILRDWRFLTDSPDLSANMAIILSVTPEGGFEHWVWAELMDGVQLQWAGNGQIVLHPGDNFTVFTEHSGIYYCLSGAEFDAPF